MPNHAVDGEQKGHRRNNIGQEKQPVARRSTFRNTGPVRKKAAKRTYVAPALEKGLDILELLALEPGGLTKAEIARRLGRTSSEVFRMLVCLEARGYISRPKGDEFIHLTLRLFQMALEHPPAKRMITEALPIMREAARAINQSCHLAVVDDGQVVILAQVDSPASQGFYVRAGSTVELMEAGSGHVILAFQKPDNRTHIVDRWRERTRKKVPADLDDHLARICETGFEVRPSYVVEGVVDVSCPILDNFSQAIAAITVPYIGRASQRTSIETVQKHLRQVSEQITQAIGGRAVPMKMK
jgi:DNA-binding IclR family transcriptional regulator